MTEVLARREEPQDEPHGHPGTDARSRILVVEDDTSLRRLFAQALEEAGFHVIPAGDGAEAIDLSLRDLPDLALIDNRLPRGSGIEVLRVLKQAHGPDLPCLMISGEEELGGRVRAFAAGADDFVSKPVVLDELLARVKAFERTRQAFLMAKRANETADRLRLFVAETAALLAHDLNNGLTVATANLQYVEATQTAEGEVKEAIEASHRAVKRMIGLVRNYVNLARFEDAALNPVRSRVDLRELLTSVSMIHDPRSSAEDRTHIEVDCPSDLVVNIDPVLIERVIHNLLNNAVRYVNRHGRIGVAASTFLAGVEDAWLAIVVGNTGPTIPGALREKLFDKYRMGSDGRAQRGMGLYFCRLACEALGGSIAIEDDEIFATKFVIRIPLAPEQVSQQQA
jgi:two-component system, sensor histidine kinase and response regulator